jgi:hypothetical protein
MATAMEKAFDWITAHLIGTATACAALGTSALVVWLIVKAPTEFYVALLWALPLFAALWTVLALVLFAVTGVLLAALWLTEQLDGRR